MARLKLVDTQKRPLYLNARVSRGDGGTITVRISCQYWIVNKSGLPLMIKQEGASGDAAGQFQEHEVRFANFLHNHYYSKLKILRSLIFL